MRGTIAICALALAGGLLLHFGLREPVSQGKEAPVGIPLLSVGQVATGAGFTSTLETFGEFPGLRNAARLLERIDAAGPSAFPHLYALFAMNGEAWQEVLMDGWAEKDPRGMLAYRLGISHVDDLDDATMAVFDALAIADPDDALDLLTTVSGRDERNALRWRLLSNLASGDKAQASRWLADNAEVFRRSSLVGEYEDRPDYLRYGDLVEAVNGVPNSEMRAELMRCFMRGGRRLLDDSRYYDAWRRIADPAIAAELFDRGFDFEKGENPELARAVFGRAREILGTNVSEGLLNWVLAWAGEKGGVESMRQAFELAMSARAREALGSTYGLSGVQSLFENLEGERLDFLLENIDRLPLGEAYRYAAESIGEEFAARGQHDAAVAWTNGLEGGVRESAFGNLAVKMSETMGVRASIEYLQAAVSPTDFADAMGGLGRRIDEITPLEEIPQLADLLDPESRTRFMAALGSSRSKNPGPLLDAVSTWRAADQNSVYRAFATRASHYVPSDAPPLTPAQQSQLLAIANAYLPDAERRAKFLKDVGVE